MTPDSPVARLLREPFVFDFFQAVRVLEEQHPDRRPVGRNGPPGAEVVRFATRASLAFPAAVIDRLDPPAEVDGPPRLVVNFFGLTGPNGVLPMAYTQFQIAHERATSEPEAGAYAAWLDLFTHRLLSLFYRAGTRYRLPLAFERAARTGRRDPVTAALLALVGLGTPGLTDRFSECGKGKASEDEGGRGKAEGGEDPSGPPSAFPLPHSEEGVEDIALLRYAELFSSATRPAVGLEGVLADYFDVSVAVETFRGRWLPLDADNQTRLGHRGANDRLGDGALVGRRVWDVAGAIRVRVGPLDGDGFRAWLPDRPRLRVLARLVRFATRDELDFDVQLVVRAAAVPPLRLAKPAGDVAPPRLGWNTWLLARPPARAASDAVFRRETLARPAA